MTHQLFRFGQPYACWGTPEQVIHTVTLTYQRPWWWLRILGWQCKEATP